ncbi:MAG: lysophospholipid acyltransferase family protein [Candidatus Onthoplasma sp.]
MFFWICFILAFIPLVLIFPIKKIGKKNLKQLKGKNYIISCNHTSNLDPVMLDITFKKKLRFLAKKELFEKKFSSAVLKSYGGIPVDRQKADLTAIKETMRLINDKKTVCIFPQGTRSKTIKVEEGSAKEGVAMFSIRTNTPVVPMMFSSKIKAFRKTKLYIGEPIYPDINRQKEKEYVSEFANLIIDKMNSLLEGEKQ